MVIGVFAKHWCTCGLEILTASARCEYCEIEERSDAALHMARPAAPFLRSLFEPALPVERSKVRR